MAAGKTFIKERAQSSCGDFFCFIFNVQATDYLTLLSNSNGKICQQVKKATVSGQFRSVKGFSPGLCVFHTSKSLNLCMLFKDRREAGQRLVQALQKYQSEEPVILGLPRGGVIVAKEVAENLQAPLDVIVVRKIPAPGNPEFAIGAMAEDGVPVVNDRLIHQMGIDEYFLSGLVEKEAEEVRRRIGKFRSGRPGFSLKGRVVIIVDDGLATGSTAQAAADFVRRQGAKKVILAVPVGAGESVFLLKAHVDEVVCLEQPENFYAVGLWYENFSQVEDEEVIEALKTASKPESSSLSSIKTAGKQRSNAKNEKANHI